MKKNALLIIVFCLFSIGFTSAYVEDKVFCTIWSNSITVTMEKEHNYKCKEYLSVLSQAINTEYNDIISIQKLIPLHNRFNCEIDFVNSLSERC